MRYVMTSTDRALLLEIKKSGAVPVERSAAAYDCALRLERQGLLRSIRSQASQRPIFVLSGAGLTATNGDFR